MWRDKIQISRKCGKPVSKTRQDKHRQCGALSGVIDTQILGRGLRDPNFRVCKKNYTLTFHGRALKQSLALNPFT